ncbi:Hsp20/alpha crystallin family protein [Arundinibacter roseus]|uniref:Hsp20/alpha crystallin family protein n=1 Tax=Arundinibacter roseus TaxID=2070510 RepID=A0A4R4KLR9_9BACT|nr:Hsp20/alpha crystallin family protein [Arundinibacter roseus]TDB68903.1 Hsp20/alpha crystallin family protein [Arundinibacter roseus]
MNTLVKNGNHQYPGFFNGFVNKSLMNELFEPAYNGTAPAVNVVENENSFRIDVAAPGLQKSDFTINLDQNRLTIASKKEQSEEEKNEKYTRREFRYASFQRTFTLPATIDSEQISATYTDGILHIELPKREEAKARPNRTIEIG